MNGIKVAIITSVLNEQTDFLQDQGLFIKIVPKLSLCACIIDKSTIWYGSINILGYSTEEDSMIKIVDIKLASEVLDIIYNDGK